MESEIIELEKQDTWNIISLLEGCKALGSRWVYKIKKNNTNNIYKYKARYVV